MTTVDGLEPTETRLLLCAAIMLGDVVASEDHETGMACYVIDRRTNRHTRRSAQVFELVDHGWAVIGDPVVKLTVLGQAMLDEHGGKVLKRYRETT